MDEWYLTDLSDVKLRAFADRGDYYIHGDGDEEENFFKIIKDTNQAIFRGYRNIVVKWKESGTLVPLLINI